MRGYQGYVADMLNDDAQDIRVLIYAGDVDFVCNWIGNKAWTVALDWQSKEAFSAAEDHEWYSSSSSSAEAAGMAKSADGFTFLQVYGAGHMVPQDQPEAALAMLNAFTSGKAF